MFSQEPVAVMNIEEIHGINVQKQQIVLWPHNELTAKQKLHFETPENETDCGLQVP